MVLATVLMLSTVVGCAGKEPENSGNKAVSSSSETTSNTSSTGNSKVTISVASWPNKDTKPEEYKKQMDTAKRFSEKFPDITVNGDEWYYTNDTYLPKAASNQLPTLYAVPFTEVNKIIDAGYVPDITKYAKEYKYTDNTRKDVMDLVTRDGKIYMIPSSVYALGLLANRSVFEKAGELDKDGLINYPKTFDELGQLAGRIKAKTGVAGFIMPTMKNVGGWHFMSIAWAYGTEFMKKDGNKWVATFNSPECAAALQFVKDLKWKYNALSDNTFIDNDEGKKMLASGQGAMFFSSINEELFSKLNKNYGVKKESLSAGLIPAGPSGKYALMGGSLYCIAQNATEEEIDAAFKWLDFTGASSNYSEDAKISRESTFKTWKDEGTLILGKQSFNVWNSGTVVDFDKEMRQKYANANNDYFKEFLNFEGVKLRSEEPVNCQQLYSIFDGCIQEVLTNKNADVNQLLKKAANDFQTNYLDKVK